MLCCVVKVGKKAGGEEGGEEGVEEEAIEDGGNAALAKVCERMSRLH
jgi:hypothetical protein